MKVVLRHQSTGRYYSAPGKWVRRADNALAFDDALTAKDYSRSHGINRTQPVYRLAPFLMLLLQEHEHEHSMMIEGMWPQARRGYSQPLDLFDRN